MQNDLFEFLDDIGSTRWSVLSWLSPLVAVGLLAFLLTASIGHGQPSTEGHPAQTVCTLSSFFSFDANDQIRDLIRIEGRGLANCRSEAGLKTEIPIHAEMEAIVIAPLANTGELSFSANSSPFVVSRDDGPLQDRFDVRNFGTESTDRLSPTVLMQGAYQNLPLQLKLSSTTGAFRKIEIRFLTLRFDDTAPTIE